MVIFTAFVFCLFFINPLFSVFNLNESIAGQRTIRTLQINQETVSKNKSAAKLIKSRCRQCRKKRSRTNSKSERKTIVQKNPKTAQQSSPTNEKNDGAVKKAGEFKGDLRNLPKTKPADRERPRREDPKFDPIPAPTPTVKPPNH